MHSWFRDRHGSASGPDARRGSKPPLCRKSRWIESAVEEQRLALLEPGGLVAPGERVEVRGRRRRVVDPLPQPLAAVDHVDRQAPFVFVREIAPQLVARLEGAQRLEGE